MIETDLIPKQIAALERMTVGQLQKRYAELFGEAARSGNKQWQLRRTAWRIQALDEGVDHEGRQGRQPSVPVTVSQSTPLPFRRSPGWTGWTGSGGCEPTALTFWLAVAPVNAEK